MNKKTWVFRKVIRYVVIFVRWIVLKLTTFVPELIPSAFRTALPMGKGDNYELGVSTAETPAGNTVKIYDLERSLCDMMRGSAEDIQTIQFAMKKYISSKKRISTS